MLDDSPRQGGTGDRPELLRVCRIGRAQGLKGEVTVRIFTDEPEIRFAPGAELFAKTPDGGEGYMFVVERSRVFKGRWILKFEGVDDRDAAEALNGTELYTPAVGLDEMMDEDLWYPKDLVGLEARIDPDNEQGYEAGLVVGKVVDVIEGPQWLLKIRLATPVRDPESGEVLEKTALVPFVEELVPEIDPAEGYLTLDPPGGLIPGL
ncbi:ribosome maturation factor RimM [Bifidobacterium choloepi]|uniref:Ribosome maturation factor RimM n=1 Tax=Bifidobacterium choloepi TaxID=2614131 RepID=A0A6I5MZU8_9BIFI|nr:ribosome maturation factor RimM [Bifidobacterium choloepi]NEG69787.1 ribosome maturation factor RimM [Bifidobacterium choloepi]